MASVRTDLRDPLVRGFAAAFEVDPGPDLEIYVTQGRGTLPAGGKLLAWDANSVHGFVFDTTNATAIRGASHLLAGLDRDLRGGKILGLEEPQILFAGGGSGLAVVSKMQGAEAIARLHRLFAERTLVATCSAITVDLGTGEIPFNELYEAAQNELTRERVLRGSDAEAAVPFLAERCQVCGRRAAAVRADQRIGGARFECEVCYTCIEEGKANRQDQRETSDFEEIADEKRGGFYAVVYADGNGIGKRISMLPSPLAYAAFSRAIDRVVHETFSALTKKYRLREEGSAAAGTRRGSAYQQPICGGDDLVAILPGDVAVPFARDFLGGLEKAVDADSDLAPESLEKLDPIGAAAGVAIGKAKFPIRHLIQEAEELLKTAKERVYRHRVRSALDFAEVADGSPRRESAKPERLEKGAHGLVQRPLGGRGGLLQSGRPYSLPELELFSRRFGKVSDAGTGLGRSQLYLLRRYAKAGLAQLRNHALYQLGRREAWRQLVADLAGDPDVIRDKERAMDHIAPTYGEHRVFDIADMIELFDHWREAPEVATP